MEGFSALRELGNEMPVLLFSDLNMPGMAGLELLQVVGCRFPSIQVIAMSGGFSGDQVPSGVAAELSIKRAAAWLLYLRLIETLLLMERRDPLPVPVAVRQPIAPG